MSVSASCGVCKTVVRIAVQRSDRLCAPFSKRFSVQATRKLDGEARMTLDTSTETSTLPTSANGSFACA